MNGSSLVRNIVEITQYEEVEKDGGLAEVPPLPEDKYQLNNTPTSKSYKKKINK